MSGKDYPGGRAGERAHGTANHAGAIPLFLPSCSHTKNCSKNPGLGGKRSPRYRHGAKKLVSPTETAVLPSYYPAGKWVAFTVSRRGEGWASPLVSPGGNNRSRRGMKMRKRSSSGKFTRRRSFPAGGGKSFSPPPQDRPVTATAKLWLRVTKDP